MSAWRTTSRTTLMACAALAWTLGLAAAPAAAQAAADAPALPSPLAPPRTGLEPVPFPSLDGLEPVVAAQLADARLTIQAAAERAGVSRRDLGAAYGALGRTFQAYEFFATAEAAYQNAERLAPSDGTWPHLLGYLYQQTGRLEEAAASFVAARRLRPDDAVSALRLGEVYLALDRLGDAREQFEQVLDVFPAAANKGLGEVALRQRRYREALDRFRSALDRVPQATALHYSIAMAYRGLGRLDDARAELERRGSGDIVAADPLVDSLAALVRGERLLVIRGARAYAAGQYEQAADAFRRAAEASPASVPAHVNLALALSQLGDAAHAVEQFQAALRIDGANHEAHAGLGQVLARQGRDADAVGHLQTAFDQTPGDATLGRELVGPLLRLGRRDAAIDVLTRTRAANPDDEDALVGLSILLADGERYGDAIALLDDGHRRFPDRAATATTLARLLASSPETARRDGRRALDLAMAVYEADPAPAHGETIALALAELGRCSEALDWIKRAATAARQAKDAAEAARLSAETAKYATVPCRPPGR